MRLGLLALALGVLVLSVVLAARRGGEASRAAREAVQAPPAEPVPPVPRTARIVGTVRNERGEGVPGAGVRAEDDVSGNRFTTDVAGDGTYALDDLGPGRYRVAATTPGHWRPAPQEVDAPEGGEARCDFVAHRGFNLRGRVQDTRDHAVEGIDIRPSFNEDQIAISDAKGTFDLGGFHSDFDRVDVIVRDPKGRCAPWEGDVFEGVVITLDDGATIDGIVVRRETGAPVAGAKLHLREERPVFAGYASPRIGEATTGRDGTFRMAGRPAGHAVLETTAPGLAPARMELEPRAGQLTSVRVELGEGGSVEVAAVDPEGRPVPGARVVEAQSLFHPWNGPVPETRTGSDGRALLEHLEPGRRRIAVASDDFLPAVAAIDVPGNGMRASVTVALRRGGAIEGRMQANPPMGSVIVMSRDYALYRELRPRSDGTYRAEGLRAGDYYVICGRYVLVTVVEGETVRCDLDTAAPVGPFDMGTEKSAAMRPGNGRIRARVVGPDGYPVRGALVAVVDATGAPLAQAFGDGLATIVPRLPLRTTAWGLPDLAPGLAPGAYDVLAVVPRGGFARTKGVRVVDGSTTDLSLAIGEGGAVEVTVADAPTGVLLGGARVHVRVPPGRGVPDAVDPFRLKGEAESLLFYRRAAAATDTHGLARIDGLSAGEYGGHAETSGGRAAEFAFTIRDGETTSVRVDLAR